MTTDEVQQIISYAYPLIQKYYGKGKLPIPKIDTSHKNTYAMHSGEPEAQGEHDATSIAEYYEGTIYLYLPNITNEEELLRSIIHEYTHYKQPDGLDTQYYDQGYTYQNNPAELEALRAEEKWHLFA